MRVEIVPSAAKGVLDAPPSKSMAHRALIAAALAEGESFLKGISSSEDMLATMDCLTALGAEFSREGELVRVKGLGGIPKSLGVLPCRESGSTLRFLIPLCLLTGEEYTLRGSERLMARPLSVYEDLSREKDFRFEKNGNALMVQGSLASGEYAVAGDVSSQFLTGLLYTLPLLEGDSVLRLTTPLESASYVDMTLAAMAEFGVEIRRESEGFFIRGGQRYTARRYTVEGDWSNAAFLDAMGIFDGQVTVRGLKENSLQGDRVYRAHFEALKQGAPTIDLTDCPDLAPVLFALAATFHGARFTGTSRLAMKESDRGAAMAEELAKCGVTLAISANEIVVPKKELHPPEETVSGHNDHRIVMAMSVLLSRLGGEIEGAEAVAKSYPDFFEDIKQLGIKVNLR